MLASSFKCARNELFSDGQRDAYLQGRSQLLASFLLSAILAGAKLSIVASKVRVRVSDSTAIRPINQVVLLLDNKTRPLHSPLFFDFFSNKSNSVTHDRCNFCK